MKRKREPIKRVVQTKKGRIIPQIGIQTIPEEVLKEILFRTSAEDQFNIRIVCKLWDGKCKSTSWDDIYRWNNILKVFTRTKKGIVALGTNIKKATFFMEGIFLLRNLSRKFTGDLSSEWLNIRDGFLNFLETGYGHGILSEVMILQKQPITGYGPKILYYVNNRQWNGKKCVILFKLFKNMAYVKSAIQ